MNWREKYKDKIVSAEEAMKSVRGGDLVVPGDFCAEAVYLMEALTKRAQELDERIRVVHGGNLGPEPHLELGMERYIDFTCLYAVPKSRRAIAEHRADYLPCDFHRWPLLFEKGGPCHPNVALLLVSQPDEQGKVSFGLSSDYTAYLPEMADLTIAQISSTVPYLIGNTVSIDKIDYLVEKDEPVLTLQDSVPGEKETKIGQIVAPMIEDRACLQLGRGKLPDYLLTLLEDRKDLGIHSEMISDGVMKLMKKGVITNRYKQIDVGKTVCCTIAGSEDLYRFVDHNPDILLKPVDYTNDPYTIGQNAHVISVNSATEVDLQGQAVADMIGTRQYSGIGGFTDFVRGAVRSRGGKSIVAFSSVTGDGKHSRIVPCVTQGAAVAATRCDIDYVATEYGIVQLWGKPVRERTKALISIAHPKFRDALTEYAKKNDLLW